MKKIILVSLLVLLTSPGGIAQKQKGVNSVGKQFAPGRVLIKLKAKSSTSSGAQLRKSASTQNLLQKIGAVSQEAAFSENYSTFKQQRLAKEIGLDRWMVATVPTVMDMNKLLVRLRQDPNVEIAEPDYISRTDAIPNDPLYSSQQYLPQIKAAQAWDTQKGDSTIVIAIIDTGVDWDHPDLAAAIWNNPTPGDSNDVRGWDFVDLTGFETTGADPNDDLFTEDNNPMDFTGHGTQVAGLAAAVTNNSIGIASISWGCKIMPLRVGFRLSGGGGMGYDLWIARAFRYAADNGAAIANLSFEAMSSIIVDATLYAYKSGVVVCKSAGNSNSETMNASSIPSWILKVASVDDFDQKASYSSYGTWVNISAPGGVTGRLIMSTTFNDSYKGDQGTSFASPLVAGLVGLVKSKFKTMDAPSLMFQIAATADNIDGLNPAYAGKLGYGRINAQNAVAGVAAPMKPVLSLSSVVLSDVLGNNNGKIEPSETIEMTAFIMNEWENATNTVATISTTDNGINISKSSANYGAIPGIRDIDNSTKGNALDKFMFTVSSDSVPRQVNIKITVTADQGYTKDFNITFGILTHLLFVDDDDGMYNVEQSYTNTFHNLGIIYDTWDRSVRGPLTASQLSKYKTVVWGCEWAFPSLDSADRSAIGGFLDNGGQLFISGQDIAWDMCDTSGNEYAATKGASKTWYENYFKTQYLEDKANTTTLNGVSGDPIGDGLTVAFTEPLYTSEGQFPDIIAPLSGAQSVFQYPVGGSGATRYASTYKVVNFGFGGFEAISSDVMRDVIMGRVYTWLSGVQLQHPPIFISADSLCNTLSMSGLFSVTVQAEDNIMMDTNATYVVFKVNGSSLDSTQLQYTAPRSFNGIFDIHSLVSQLHASDTIRYYYSIRDASVRHSASRLPSAGFYSFQVGRQLIDDFETMRPIWNFGLNWGYEIMTKDGDATNTTISDSYGVNYLPNTENILTLTSPFDLSAYTTARMYFRRWMQIDASDTLYIEYRKGAGEWNIIRKMNGGIFTLKKDSVDLPGSSNATALRFRLKTDGASESSGILLDDIEVVGGAPIVGVEENKTVQVPKNFALQQNYPNPFNPTTTIKYELPVTGHVTLKVYDMLGREAAVLTDEMKVAGYYSATFDASKLSSGVYFSRMTVQPENGNAVILVKKMLLVK